MNQIIYILGSISGYIMLCGFALVIVSAVYENATVYKWDSVSFRGGLAILNEEVAFVYEENIEQQVCNVLTRFFEHNEIPADAYLENTSTVLVRTHQLLRQGFFRGRIEFVEGRLKIDFYYSTVTLFSYLTAFGFGLKLLCQYWGDVDVYIISIISFGFIFFDYKRINRRVLSISSYLLATLKVEERTKEE